MIIAAHNKSRPLLQAAFVEEIENMECWYINKRMEERRKNPLRLMNNNIDYLIFAVNGSTPESIRFLDFFKKFW